MSIFEFIIKEASTGLLLVSASLSIVVWTVLMTSLGYLSPRPKRRTYEACADFIAWMAMYAACYVITVWILTEAGYR